MIIRRLQYSIRVNSRNSCLYDLNFEPLGKFEFKNVTDPLEVFALANKGFAIPKPGEMKGKIQTPVGKKTKWLIPTAVSTLVLLIVLLVLSGVFTKKQFADGEVSLGIIPFRNISGDEANSYYGFGMASEIRTKLSLSKKFEHLSSIQATASYANSTLSPKQIAQELKVDYLLMGMFQIAGEDIKVSVELLDAESGKSVEEIPQYQNKLTEIFQIQSEIANRVLRQFSFFNQDAPAKAEYTPDVVAYDHYLKGYEILNSDRSPTRRKNALVQFETAIQIDSNYLSAWVGLINAKTRMLWYADTLSQENLKRDMDYVETHFPEAWEKNLARGLYEYHGLSNYENGRQFFLKALDENPENSRANAIIAAIYKRQLKTSEALFHITKAKDQNPNEASIWDEIGLVLSQDKY